MKSDIVEAERAIQRTRPVFNRAYACLDCDRQYPTGYMVKNEIWRMATAGEVVPEGRRHILCVKCLSRRLKALGHELKLEDFNPAVPINELLFLGVLWGVASVNELREPGPIPIEVRPGDPVLPIVFAREEAALLCHIARFPETELADRFLLSASARDVANWLRDKAYRAACLDRDVITTGMELIRWAQGFNAPVPK